MNLSPLLQKLSTIQLFSKEEISSIQPVARVRHQHGGYAFSSYSFSYTMRKIKIFKLKMVVQVWRTKIVEQN